MSAGERLPLFNVLDAGPLDTLQDAGRPDAAWLGVPRSGACDPWGLAVANLLLANAPDAAAIEVTGGGLALGVGSSCVVALGGADLGAAVPGERRRLRPGEAHLLRDGARLVFDPSLARHPAAPLRAYLALPGGVAGDVVLGSRSTCLIGGFGGFQGRALRPGDELACLRPADPGMAGRLWPGPPHPLDEAHPAPGEPVTVRFVAGPHAGWGPPDLLDRLARTTWDVRPDSDRMGLRLDGERLWDCPGEGPGELVSLPMVWGAIQVPPDGRPIVLLADHQTVGGYPVPAVVIRADLPIVGQLRPGTHIRLEEVSLDRAAQLRSARVNALRQAGVRLRGPDPWDALASAAE